VGTVKNDGDSIGMGKAHGNYHRNGNSAVNIIVMLSLFTIFQWMERKTMDWRVNTVQS